MKPYILLITLLFSGLGISVAQQRTRDILFPSFQQDYAALQQKESKLPASQTKDARSAREQMFTNYQPQTAPTRSRTNVLKQAGTSGGRNASDISAAEALKTGKSRHADLPVPAIPSQGNETERSSGLSKPASPAVITSPAKAASPAAAPIKRSFEPKKQ